MPGLPGPEEEAQLRLRLPRVDSVGMDYVHRLVVHPRRHAAASKKVFDQGGEKRRIAYVDSHDGLPIMRRERVGDIASEGRTGPPEVQSAANNG
jgi:hypothetical protein